VLLPVTGLLRRLDLAEVIGAALLARARNESLRQIGAALGVPLSTVRGWLGRFTQRAVLIAGHFARLAAWLEPGAAVPQPRGSPLVRAVEAIGVAALAAARRLGAHTGPFEFASGPVAGGCLPTPTRPFRRRGSPGCSPATVAIPARAARSRRGRRCSTRFGSARATNTGKEPPCRPRPPTTAAKPSRCSATP